MWKYGLVFFAMPCHTVPCRAAPEHSFAKPGKSGGARQFPGAIKHWTTLDSLRQIRQIRQCFWHILKFLEISPMQMMRFLLSAVPGFLHLHLPNSVPWHLVSRPCPSISGPFPWTSYDKFNQQHFNIDPTWTGLGL